MIRRVNGVSTTIARAFERYQAGDLHQAEVFCRQALAANEHLADGWLLLGVLADHARATPEALRFLRRAADLAPNDPRTWNALGTTLHGAGDLDGAQAVFETVLHRRPDYAPAWHNLGEVHRALGRHRAAADCYRRALQADPGLRPAVGNLLFSLQFDPALTDAQIWEEHLRWGNHVAARLPVLEPPTNVPHPDRPLTVGYIGPDFREHAVARFFEPLLAAHNRQHFRWIMYSECPIVDAVGQRLRAHGDRFCIIRGRRPDDVARQVRADGVDILVDLAGHTRDNRLDVLALRPAPLQMTFLGYPYGTGLPRIDYRITDAVLDPPNAQPRPGGWESLLRLPAGVCCFRPPEAAPNVSELPLLANGFITLGCHHPLPKLNEPLLALWACLAQRLPSARFLFVRDSWEGAAARELRQRLTNAGIPERQVELRRCTAEPANYLQSFADIDIVLDALPFNSHTMTCEALWMGVPVLTLRGDRPAGRLSASVLTALGLPEFIAESAEDFLAKVFALPGQQQWLAELRAGLRQRMMVLTDGRYMAACLEGLYREAWKAWCRSQPRGATQAAASSQTVPWREEQRQPVHWQAVPGQAVPGQAVSGQVVSGQALPGQAAPWQASSWQAVHARGCAALEAGDAETAKGLFEQACELDPAAVPPRAMLAGILTDCCDVAAAREHYARALRAGPDAKLRIAAALALPPIYDSRQHLLDCRQQLLEQLEHLHRDGVRLDPMRGPIPNLFLAAYHGENDRELMRLYARLFEPAAWAVEPLASTPTANDRLRIGFISHYFSNHTIGTLNRGLVRQLDRQRFDVTVLSAGGVSDETNYEFRQYADTYITLPADTADAVRLIRGLGLDRVLFTDLGMSCVTLALAHARLAPHQAVLWGHPCTTGIATIDDFLSSELFEIPEADGHYTERLCRLQGINTFYFRPRLNRTYSRSDFHLPADGHLFGCLQTLFKLHPDFDGALRVILEADPKARLVLIEGRTRAWKERLLARWRLTLPGLLDRLHWISPLPRADFLGLSSVCDAMLDPFHFGGGNTTLEALALGVPVITLPSPYLRARLTQGFYQAIGLSALVAKDQADYVAIAVRLMHDHDWRHEIVLQINQKAPALFEHAESVRAIEAYFEQRPEN